MAMPCIIAEISEILVENRYFSYTLVHNNAPRKKLRIFSRYFVQNRARWLGYSVVQNIVEKFDPVSRGINITDDRQTELRR